MVFSLIKGKGRLIWIITLFLTFGFSFFFVFLQFVSSDALIPWGSNTTINSSLPDVGDSSALSVFTKDGWLYLISGNAAGTFNGFVYNSSLDWEVNTTINSSLPDIGTYSAPSVFTKDGWLYLISGNSVGTFNGFVYNSSLDWEVNTTINSSLPDVGDYSTPSVFTKDGWVYLISGNNAGTFSGFVNSFSSETTPPTFTNMVNLTFDNVTQVIKDIDATDGTAVDSFWINDTTYFQINRSGYFKNSTQLNLGIYWLNVSVNDTLNNLNSEVFWVNITSVVSGNCWIVSAGKIEVPPTCRFELNTLGAFTI